MQKIILNYKDELTAAAAIRTAPVLLNNEFLNPKSIVGSVDAAYDTVLINMFTICPSACNCIAI